MSFIFLADLILIIHVLYVGIVVGSVPLIILGGMCQWQWVRNRLFRLTHLGMIAIVVLESFLSLPCPLTLFETSLRDKGSDTHSEHHDFIAYWLDHILFYSFAPQTFVLIYFLFGALVLSLFLFVPLHDPKP